MPRVKLEKLFYFRATDGAKRKKNTKNGKRRNIVNKIKRDSITVRSMLNRFLKKKKVV